MTVSRGATALAAVAVLLSAATASAADLGQWVRGLKVTPFLTERAEYETNVFQTQSHTSDDLISRTVPGFLATYDRGPVSLGFGYRAEILRFLDLTDQNNTHHIATLKGGLNFPRLKLGLAHDFTLTSDPPNSEINGRLDSTTITIAPDIEIPLTPRFAVGANYGFTRVEYATSALSMNHDSHLFGASVFWKFVPKADLRLSYSYGFSDYRQVQGFTDRDVKADHRMTAGLRGDLTPKISSSFYVGYGIHEFESSRLKDETLLVTGGDWIYRPTDRTRFFLATSRSFQDSIFGQFNETVTYVATSATVGVEQMFGTKLRANARLMGTDMDYPRKEVTVREISTPKFRRDTLLGWGGGLDYDIQKWLSIGAEYSHTRRDSTFDEFDYKDDKVTAKVTLQF